MKRATDPGKLFWLLISVSIILYVMTGYFTKRYESGLLLVCFSGLFICYTGIIRNIHHERAIDLAYWAGILFRVTLMLSLPNLSDDIYRFIWDGRLVAAGMNPYSRTPVEILEHTNLANSDITAELFMQFGKDTYSSYPPLNQLIFYISVIFSPRSIFGSILVIRLFILMFELGNIRLIRVLLRQSGLPQKTGLLYVLNPLVILELTGNLHFEALVIFFLLLSLYFLDLHRLAATAGSLGLAIQAKMIPLIFLPVIWRKEGGRRGTWIAVICLVVFIIPFLPFFEWKMILGLLKSLNLYFQKFEFNAGLYYLIRQIGLWIFGFNIILISGPLLGMIAFSGILILSFSKYALKAPYPELFLWILMIYLALTTTLHPWYITTLLVISVFTGFRFPVAWSFLVFLSYRGYTETGYQNDLLLVAVEYIGVYGLLAYEMYHIYKKNKKSPLEGLLS